MTVDDDLGTDALPVVPPCPSWCASTAALHPLDADLRAVQRAEQLDSSAPPWGSPTGTVR